MLKIDARNVVVTGAAGHLGRHVMQAFTDAGWKVRGFDITEAPDVTALDLRDPAAARAHLSGADVIAHCAALPRPVGFSHDTVFATNMALMHSAVCAAEENNARIVYASSYSVIGLPFAPNPPKLTALPVTEAESALPQDVYALTKWLGEEMLSAYVRRTGGTAVSLRLPWVHTAHSFGRDVVAIQDDPASRIHLWAWIDATDAGRGFVAAASAAIDGHERLFLSAADTFSTRPTAELVEHGWPDTPHRHALLDRQSLIDGARARDILGFEPAVRWQDYVESA